MYTEFVHKYIELCGLVRRVAVLTTLWVNFVEKNIKNKQKSQPAVCGSTFV